jgi:hypothetical protein
VAYWVLRYRYLTEYSRLPPEPQRKEPQIDLFPDSQEGDSKPGLQNYLDEVSPHMNLLMIVLKRDQDFWIPRTPGLS